MHLPSLFITQSSYSLISFSYWMFTNAVVIKLSLCFCCEFDQILCSLLCIRMLSCGSMDSVATSSSLLWPVIYSYLKVSFLVMGFWSTVLVLYYSFIFLLIFLILLHNLLHECLSKNLNLLCFIHQCPLILLSFNHLLLSYLYFLCPSFILDRLLHMEKEENMILLDINILTFKTLIWNPLLAFYIKDKLTVQIKRILDSTCRMQNHTVFLLGISQELYTSETQHARTYFSSCSF